MLGKLFERIYISFVIYTNTPACHNPTSVTEKPEVGVLHFFLVDIIFENELANNKNHI
jgi:hypothetical protein